MSPEKKSLTLLKVDNWGVFLLQRLQLMFAKGDFCDLTLKFNDEQELKVHRLVLTTCTKFFQEIKDSDDIYKMPDTLSYNAMLPIVNFMYSGRLEFKPELHESLLDTAKVLNMAILVQLLIAQKKPNDKTSKLKKEENKKTLKVLTPKQTASQPSSPGMLAEKKLPFWRKRALPVIRMPDKKNPIVSEEDPLPTRFEWPFEDTSSLIINSPSFSSISYESEPVISSSLEAIKNDENDKTGEIKRRVVPPLFSSTPRKIPRLAEQSQIIMGTLSDDDDDTHFETLHSYEDSDDEVTVQPASEIHPPLEVEATPKPILKPNTTSPGPSKRVRFCLEDKENVDKKSNKAMPPQPSTKSQLTDEQLILQLEGQQEMETNNKSMEIIETGPDRTIQIHKINNVTRESDLTPNTDSSSTKQDPLPNHAKIIAEVLKKFPDLVKNNKNIKLKITTPGVPNFKTISLDNSSNVSIPPSKSSIVVLKPSPKGNEKPQNNDENHVSNIENHISDIENITGPWICKKCSSPQNFESYFLFRKHLQTVHMEKVDSKMCEYCGYKASKRNLHLFHLYTKHNVPPPRNIKFPKCNVCNYVALNDNLLSKHVATHQSCKELVCNICKLTFKSSNSFQAHCVTCKPTNEIRNYSCKKCNKMFRTNVSLKAHFKDCKQTPTNEGTSLVSLNNAMEPMEVIQVPIMETMGTEKTELMQLPSGLIVTESSNVLLQENHSSLSNVTTSMPSSIGFTVLPDDHQTVILLDENSEFFLQGNNSVVVTSENESQEYIVPDILPDNVTRLYTTGNISYAMNATSVITYPMVHVPAALQDHGGADTLTIPVSEAGDLYVSDKEIAMSVDESVNLQGQIESHQVSIAEQELDKSNLPVDETVQFVKATQGGDCIVSMNSTEGTSQECNFHLTETVDNNCLVSVSVDSGVLPSNQGSNMIIGDTQPMTEVNQQNDNQLKAVDLTTEWDFENEEEDIQGEGESEGKPSRPSIDLHELT